MTTGEWMLWRRRRTPRWQCLSLAARGAAEGIAVALDDRGELSLGKRGLAGLAALLSRPWEEVKPAIDELLESETFVHDATRGVIFDPQHVQRQSVESLGATNTFRVDEKRSPRSVDHPDPPSDHFADHSDQLITSNDHQTLSGDHDRRQLTLFTDHQTLRGDPSSSSDQIKINREKKSDRFTCEPDDPLEPSFRLVFDQVQLARSVELLPAEIVWANFVDFIVDKKKSYASRAGLKRRWREWVLHERPRAVAENAAPSSGPKSPTTRPDDSGRKQERYERERASREFAIRAGSHLVDAIAGDELACGAFSFETKREIAKARLHELEEHDEFSPAPEPRSMSA